MAQKRNYIEWSKEELIREILALKKQKTYGLVWEREKTKEDFDLFINWEGEKTKEEFSPESKDKFPVLAEVKDKEINSDKDKPVNLLIEGDNYHSLAVLNFTHKNSVDVIYIDPPYNTGNKDFKYNDKFVDKEDGYRHSKWLSFMSKRLALAKNLLKDTGVIFISIDDNEVAQLKLLCDDLFGEENFITNIIWQSKTGSSDAKTIDTITEYILVYTKIPNKAKFQKYSAFDINRYRYKDKYETERGPYYTDNLDRGGLRYHDSLNYGIKCPDGKVTFPNGRTEFKKDGWTWKWGKDKVEWGIKNDFIVFKKSDKKASGWAVCYKNYLLVDNEGTAMERGAPYKNVIDDIKTGEGATVIKEIFGHQIFKYSKPPVIIQRLLMMVELPKNALILDFMAGSGTTGHAILEINKENNENISFILCTNNEDNNGDGLKICTDICYPRLKKVSEKLGGNLKYYKTDFVEAEQTDKNKRKLVDNCTEMLCIKENTFEKVKDAKKFKIFKNDKLHLGIIFDDEYIDEFVKEAEKISGKIHVYVFSHDDSVPTKEFKTIKNKLTLCPIPETILKVYRKVFKND